VQILSVGFTLPDSQVDNYDWGSAPSFFDYDAIVVDPYVAVSELIEGILRGEGSRLTYSDEPIEDGPTTPTSIGLADLLRRRAEETEMLLARGGLVVCFGYPDVAHPRVSGFQGAYRYYWLPAAPGKDFGPAYLRHAHGTHVTVTDYEHPFAELLEQVRNNVFYRVMFTEGPNGLAAEGKVIGRSPGGAAIAIEYSVGQGRVVFLPALPARLTPSERSGVASRLVAAIRNTLLMSAEGSPPEWVNDYPLPGIEAAEKEMTEAEARIEALEAEAEQARGEFRKLDRFRRLLWQEGKYGYDLPVRDALALLGMTTYSRVDEPASFYCEGETLFVETESSTRAVGMEPHYRLRERIEGEIQKEGRKRAGLIVINGYREQQPAEREQQFTDSLRVAAESMRYCIIEASTLFEAVRRHFEGTGDAKAFAQRILKTEGYLSPEAARGETAADASTA